MPTTIKSVSKASVTVSVGGASLPLWADSVTVVYDFQEFVVTGQPVDYVKRVSNGGTISCSGYISKSADIFAFLSFATNITVNGSMTFKNCRPDSFSVSPGSDRFLQCSVTYRFDYKA